MRVFGSEVKRTYHECRVVAAGFGKKIKFVVGVKNRKISRTAWVKVLMSDIGGRLVVKTTETEVPEEDWLSTATGRELTTHDQFNSVVFSFFRC